MTDDEALSPAQEPGARVAQNSGETPAQVIADAAVKVVADALMGRSWEEVQAASDALDALDRAGYVIAPREALDEALEDMLDMRSYVPDYFADKWEHDKAIARFTALIESGATPRKDAET